MITAQVGHKLPGRSLSKNAIEQQMKSVAAACTARPQRFLWREILFSGRKIVSLQISRPEAAGFK